MAVYFPRGRQAFNALRSKFEDDCAGVAKNSAVGIAFVTNQEMTLAERESLRNSQGHLQVEIYHLERITVILDSPKMLSVREQFLEISPEGSNLTNFGGQGGSALGAGGGGGLLWA